MWNYSDSLSMSVLTFRLVSLFLLRASVSMIPSELITNSMVWLSCRDELFDWKITSLPTKSFSLVTVYDMFRGMYCAWTSCCFISSAFTRVVPPIIYLTCSCHMAAIRRISLRFIASFRYLAFGSTLYFQLSQLQNYLLRGSGPIVASSIVTLSSTGRIRHLTFFSHSLQRWHLYRSMSWACKAVRPSHLLWNQIIQYSHIIIDIAWVLM